MKGIIIYTILIFGNLYFYSNYINRQLGVNKATKQRYIVFNYQSLMRDTLNYFKYKNDSKVRITQFQRRDGIEYKSYLREIDNENEINLCVYSPQEASFENSTPFLNHARDYIQIQGKKFIFDQLIHGDGYKYLNEPPNSMVLMNAYKFDFNRRAYFAAFFITALSSSNPDFYIVLFDITQKFNPLLLLSEYQASRDINCLGDFNQDNKLDFAQYHFGDKLFCKTLRKNNQFKKLNGYYLTIVHSTFEPKVDLEESNWFFDLDIRKN